MNDSETQIEDLKKRILAFAQERDWEQFHSPKNLSMAISAEAAEEAKQNAVVVALACSAQMAHNFKFAEAAASGSKVS